MAVAENQDIGRDLTALEAGLKQLEAEYNMFFSGRLPRPPWETRGRVDAILKRWDRRRIDTSHRSLPISVRCRRRYQTFVDLWDRGLRAREEGRPARSPRAAAGTGAETGDAAGPRILHVTVFQDPLREMDKLHALYDSLMDARREAGDDGGAVPPLRHAGQGPGREAAATRAVRRWRFGWR